MQRSYPLFITLVVITLGLHVLSQEVFSSASEEAILLSKDPQTYEAYQSLIQERCDTNNSEQKWNNPKEWGTIVPPPTYAPLDASAISRTISATIAWKNLPSEKEKIVEELESIRLGNVSVLKSVEVARVQYRSAMNNIFACGIIDSRSQMLIDLQKKINEKFPAKNSEIIQKLQKEEKKLQAVRNTLPCKAIEKPGNTITPEARIINSSTKQFCHFSYYLLYVRDNLEKNNLRVMEIERAIGQWNGTNIPQTTESWIREASLRSAQIDNELARATNTLPRAIRTFQEMKRTFNIHIMLTIIYDDYLRLRSNLSEYFNATSQLFEKANNAQDTNTSS